VRFVFLFKASSYLTLGAIEEHVDLKYDCELMRNTSFMVALNIALSNYGRGDCWLDCQLSAYRLSLKLDKVII